VSILRAELNYPEERALHFVKRFDHNKDGKLSVAEFRQFRGKIEETYVNGETAASGVLARGTEQLGEGGNCCLITRFP